MNNGLTVGNICPHTESRPAADLSFCRLRMDSADVASELFSTFRLSFGIAVG